MTPKQMKKLLNVWQKRLRIQDWDINVEIVNPNQMQQKVGREVLGACSPHPFKKKADIVVLEAKYLDPLDDNQETILVHELVHILLNPNDLQIDTEKEESAINIAYERSIDQLSRILVGAFNG